MKMSLVINICSFYIIGNIIDLIAKPHLFSSFIQNFHITQDDNTKLLILSFSLIEVTKFSLVLLVFFEGLQDC